MSAPGANTNILNARSKTKGAGTIINPEIFLKQNFQQPKQHCLEERVRYIDEIFPPERTSIGEGILSPADLAKVIWLRPSVGSLSLSLSLTHTHTHTLTQTHTFNTFLLLQKMVFNPSFTVEGMSRFDFSQGMLGKKS